MTTRRVSMIRWLTRRRSIAGGVLQTLIVAPVAAIILENVWRAVINGGVEIRPALVTNAVVAGALFLTLLYAAMIGRRGEAAWLRGFVALLAAAYFLTAILYALPLLPAAMRPPTVVGFDPFTDVLGSFLFLGAWAVVAHRDPDKASAFGDLLAQFLLALILIAAGGAKWMIETGVALPPLWTADSGAATQAARLVLNVANGAILFGLYATMRRLLPAPFSVIHLIILLYACAQVAAPGRDCLNADPSCDAMNAASLESIVALAIAWTLVIGKLAFVMYAMFAFYTSDAPEPDRSSK